MTSQEVRKSLFLVELEKGKVTLYRLLVFMRNLKIYIVLQMTLATFDFEIENRPV